MFEIDFLPEWYRQRQRRQLCVQRQTMALGIIFLTMIAWNSFASRHVSMASAELSLGEAQRSQAERLSLEYRQLRKDLLSLKKILDVSREMDAGLNVASIMVRMSELIPDAVVLNDLQIMAPVFTDLGSVSDESEHNSHTRETGLDRRILATESTSSEMVIRAETTDTQAVAVFLSDLERSPNFNHVHVRYLRSSGSVLQSPKVTSDADDTTPSGGQVELSESTEFEIRCRMVPRDRS